jgi:hypothetical protein
VAAKQITNMLCQTSFVVSLSNHEQYLGRLEHPLQLCPEQMLRATLFIIGSSALLRANGAILFSE